MNRQTYYVFLSFFTQLIKGENSLYVAVSDTSTLAYFIYSFIFSVLNVAAWFNPTSKGMCVRLTGVSGCEWLSVLMMTLPLCILRLTLSQQSKSSLTTILFHLFSTLHSIFVITNLVCVLFPLKWKHQYPV